MTKMLICQGCNHMYEIRNDGVCNNCEKIKKLLELRKKYGENSVEEGEFILNNLYRLS